jgi:hypothetical protein
VSLSTVSLVTVGLSSDVDDVTRESARQAAERELIKPEYHHVKPLMMRFLEWVVDRLSDLLRHATAATPGGALGLVGLLLLLVLLGVLVRYRVGRLAATARRHGVFDAMREQSAAEHRAAAERAAAAGDWATAVRERFRAVVRTLEERTVLEPRLGRTADEAAAEAAPTLPEAADALRSAARRFDDVVYGGRAATDEAYLVVAAADEAVTASRPVFA